MKTTRGQCYKTFFGRNLRMWKVFGPGKPFQPSLMFEGKTRSLSKSGAPQLSFIRVGSALNRKH
jgi:hypothetical protein